MNLFKNNLAFQFKICLFSVVALLFCCSFFSSINEIVEGPALITSIYEHHNFKGYHISAELYVYDSFDCVLDDVKETTKCLKDYKLEPICIQQESVYKSLKDEFEMIEYITDLKQNVWFDAEIDCYVYNITTRLLYYLMLCIFGFEFSMSIILMCTIIINGKNKQLKI